MTVSQLPDRLPAPAPPIGRHDRSEAVLGLLPVYVELAEKIANTEFVPGALRRRPEAVLAALLSGAERGLGPMESLRSVHVIDGRPTLSAEAMRALVFAAGHEIDIVESTATKATVVGRRAGSASTSPPFTWTLDRARRARLAGKDNWAKYPEAMLLARASTDLCRAIFPDVIAGLASTEEAIDEATPEPKTTRRAPRLPAPMPTPELAGAEADPTPPPVAMDTSAPVTRPEYPTPPEYVGTPWPPGNGDPGSTRATTPDLDDVNEVDDIAGPPTAHDPNLARRLHAEITKAFPDVPSKVRDRWRHALVVYVTRDRLDGPVSSSNDLTIDEQLALSDRLARIMRGTATVSDGPDGTVEIRAGRHLYVVTLDPPNVTDATTDTEEEADP